MKDKDKISAAEAARILGVSLTSFYNYVRAGRITPIPLDGPTILKQPPRKYWRADIEAFLQVAAVA